MTESGRADRHARFDVTNVGGIDETSVAIPPGVTVLAGKNATNRTSFLQAIQAGLGSTNASLKGDADRGAVELTVGDQQYRRELVRRNGEVTFSGEGYLDDPTVADLFAFLLEDNEARQAVARGEDLRELIVRPIDVEAIRADIESLEAEKAAINDDLADVASLKSDLPELERRRNSLREEIEAKREELTAMEAEVDAASVDVEQRREEQARMEELLAELRETRNELERIRYDVDATEESITSLKQERTEVRDDLAELPETPLAEAGDLDDEIDRLRRTKQAVERDIQDLQSAIQFNEEMLGDGGGTIPADLAAVEDGGTEDSETADPGIEHTESATGAEDDGHDSDSAAVTDRLVDDEGVVCWTCGSAVSTADIENTLAALRSARQSKLDESTELQAQLDDLTGRRREAEQTRERRSSLQKRLDTIESELEQRRDRLNELTEQRAALTDDVDRLEEAVEAIESADFDELLDRHREANELEFELEALEQERTAVTDDIERIEAELDRESDLERRRDQLLEELAERRTRIDRIEAEAVESFNTHMDAILDVLGYGNLERIWIDRQERTERDGRETVTRSTFELHVVRSTESGAAYEDTVEHLSESEREVTGLIFALAGYLVHDVHEAVPVMLLDSLEAIDSERIATLVDYLADYADYLVVALLPEDAQALDDDYVRITDV